MSAQPRDRAGAAATFESLDGDVVRPFERLSRADVDYAGGKGANLGELTAAGFPVPPGFVVGAPTYAAFCDVAGLRGRIEQRLATVDVEDTESASFAGMNETILNVRGRDAVVEAVRRCWSSLFGARTIYYRAKRGFGQADMDIAVDEPQPERGVPCSCAGSARHPAWHRGRCG